MRMLVIYGLFVMLATVSFGGLLYMTGLAASFANKCFDFAAGTRKRSYVFLYLSAVQLYATTFVWYYLYDKYNVFRNYFAKEPYMKVILGFHGRVYVLVVVGLLLMVLASNMKPSIATSLMSLLAVGCLVSTVVHNVRWLNLSEFRLDYLVALVVAAVVVAVQVVIAKLLISFFKRLSKKWPVTSEDTVQREDTVGGFYEEVSSKS